MAARSVSVVSRRQQWQQALRVWLPVALLALLLIGVLVFVCCLVPLREAEDLRGAATQHGSGGVTSFTYGGMGQAGNRSPDQVGLRLNGQEATYSGPKFLLLRKGQRVQVTYRIGKSGNIYVDDIEPSADAGR
jgi:hypothetical protein